MASGGLRDVEVEAYLGRTVASEAWYRAKEEDSYAVSEEYTNASTGDTADLLLSNPAGSGKSAIVHKNVGNPSAKSYVRVYDAFDEATIAGTDVNIENNLLDSGGEGGNDDGVVTAKRDCTFTATNTYHSEIVGSGAGGLSTGGSSSIYPMIVEPGRRIVIEVEKLVADGSEVAITAEWFERDGVYSEELQDPAEDEVR